MRAPYKTQSQKIEINIESARSERVEHKDLPHFLLFTASIVAASLFKVADHDVIERMGIRVKMLGYGKPGKLIANTAQVLTKAFT